MKPKDLPCIDNIIETYDTSQRVRGKRAAGVEELDGLYKQVREIENYLRAQDIRKGEEKLRLLRKIYTVQTEAMAKKEDYSFLNAEIQLEIYNKIFEAIKD